MITALFLAFAMQIPYLCEGNPLTNFLSPPKRDDIDNDSWNARNLQYEANNSKRLQTIINGTNGSYGNMFTVRAKKDLVITSLEFFCAIDANISYEVYTKPGSYIGFEIKPENWTLICNETVISKEPDDLTQTSQFEDLVYLDANSTQSFYITLKTGDLRYTIGEQKEGDIFVEDNNLEILEGNGIAGYPFGTPIFSPRVFNGAVHYYTSDSWPPILLTSPTLIPSSSPSLYQSSMQTRKVNGTEIIVAYAIEDKSTADSSNISTSPTSIPSSSPSLYPSSPPTEKVYQTNIIFTYDIEHNSTTDMTNQMRFMDSKVRTFLSKTFANKEERVRSLVEKYGLTLVSVSTIKISSEHNACRVMDQHKKCSVVDMQVTVNYEKGISEETIKHNILMYAQKIEKELEFSKTAYIGIVGVETNFFLIITGIQQDILDTNAILLLEDRLKTFVGNKLPNITLTSVQISPHNSSKNESHSVVDIPSSSIGAKPRVRTHDKRMLKKSEMKITVLSIFFIGNYLPPPLIDFNDKVINSLQDDGNTNDFLIYLQQNIPAFQNATSIKPTDNELNERNRTGFAADTLYNPKKTRGFLGSKLSFIVFGALSLIAVAILMLIYMFVNKQRKKKVHRDLDDQSSLENIDAEYLENDSDVEEKRKRSLLWDT